MTKNILILFIAATCLLPARAQSTHTISGTVLDGDSLPVQGAYLRLLHNNTAVLSNIKGRFTINAYKLPDTLLIQYVGHADQQRLIKLEDVSGLTIRLTGKTHLLQEVVVQNGYQSIVKDRATGSFAMISNKLFNQQTGSSVLARLEGLANGLTFDKKRASAYATGLMVRGLSSIGGPKDPLVVLDNFPYEGDLNNINPNDVENITLLKDAAAASIWGSRAGNGVIVITTKKAAYQQPLTVEFSSSVSLSAPPNLGFARPISTSDYIDVEQFLYNKGFYNSNINAAQKPALSPVIEFLIKKSNGQLSAADADTRINALRSADVRNDFNNYVYKDALNQQYALSVRSGGNGYSWLLSAGVDRNLSELSALYRRITLRSDNSFKIGSRLQLFTGISFIQSASQSGKNGYGSIVSGNGGALYPYAQLADSVGNALPVIRNYRQTYLDTVGQGKLLDWKYYPLDDYRHTVTALNRYDLMASLRLSYRLGRSWLAELQYRYENQRSSGQTLYDLQSFYTRDLINSFAQINYSTGQLTNKIPSGGINDLSNNLLEAHQGRFQLNYAHSWEGHQLIALAGGEIRDTRSLGNAYRVYGYNDAVLTYSNVDYTNTYPSLVTGFSSFIPGNSSLSLQNNRFVSAYSNLSYTYRERYILSASARRDASNIFGVNTNQKWSPLWSAGAAWQLSKESFYKVNWLPYLKLAATYGYSGNIDPNQTAVTTMMYQSNSPYTLSPYATINRYGNPDLRWEQISQLNLRLEVKNRNNRLSGTLEWYCKKGTGLYGLVPSDYTTGTGATLLKNAASMTGKGIDLEINSLNLNKPLLWQTTFILNTYHDEVTAYYTNTAKASTYIYSANTYTLAPLKGYPVYSVFSYRWAGLDPQNGNPQGYYKKQVSTDYNSMMADSLQNTQYNGPALPLYQLILRNTFSYKSFSLNINILGKLGYYFRRNSIDYAALFNNGSGNADYARRWQKPGDEQSTNVPSMTYPLASNRDVFYSGSEVLVEKGDHIRLQYITASYEFTRKQYSRLPFQKLRMFITGNNLGILWRANSLKLDPDYADNAIPPSASFTLGCTIHF
jgi:TonB-linked SusC/RagA family outer membrane protein